MDDSTERLLRLLGNAAQIAAPLIPGGGIAVEAGQAILAALKAAKALHGGSVPPEAAKGEAMLMEKVCAHAERTFDRAERGD